MQQLPRQVLLKARFALAYLVVVLAAGRALLAEKSFYFFCWYYLDVKLTWYQLRWAKKLLRSRRCLVLGPRGHGKSELVSKLLPLWLICRNRDVRILLVTISEDKAKRFAVVIRRELEHNEKLIRDFGLFYDVRRCDFWGQRVLQVIRPCNLKDPTFEAIGIKGAVTGGRCDFLLMDDIIDVDAVNTSELMVKTLERVRGELLKLLEPTGCAWMIGTRKNFGDIYGWAIKNSLWSVLHYKAIIREPEKSEIITLTKPLIRDDGTEQQHVVVIRGKDKGACLWPEHKSMEDLILERHESGSVVFNREMQNDVVDEETTKFRMAWLEQCRDESLSYIAGHLPEHVREQYRVIVVGGDLSLVIDKKHAMASDSDYMVQVGLALRDDGCRALLALERERGLTPKTVEKRAIAFNERIGPYRYFMEANSFGVIHAHNLIEGTDMKLVKHYTGKNKNDPYEGLPHLSALFETAKFRLPYMTERDKKITDTLIEEFHAFGADVHDDQVMGVWIAEHGILRWLKGQARLRRRSKGSRG